MRDLDISEVARQAGIPPSTLRYYEDKGLIRSVGRRGLRRQFDPAVLEQRARDCRATSLRYRLTFPAFLSLGSGSCALPREVHA